METLAILAIVIGSFAILVGLSVCLFGFRPVGVAAGSCAACCQSIIGNVVKGSCFALMTCLAMRGVFIALIKIGLLVLAGVGIYLMLNSKWLESAYDWVKDFASSLGHKTSSITVEKQLRDTYGWFRNVSLTKCFNTTKGFLQR